MEKVFLLEDGSTVWERNELYLGGECYPLKDSDPDRDYFKDNLTRVVDNVSGRIINEIRFP